MGPRIGDARFDQLLKVPIGVEMGSGRVARRQNTSRPCGLWPEVWKFVDNMQKRTGINEGTTRSLLIESASSECGINAEVDGILMDTKEVRYLGSKRDSSSE